MLPRRLALVVPNYYPVTCGVGDYSMRLGTELLRRGIEVRVFTHAPAEPNPEGPELSVSGVPATMPLLRARAILRDVERWDPDTVWIQYTPQMFDPWRFGSVAVPLLVERLRRSGRKIVVVAHELYLPWSPRPDMTVGAISMRVYMGALLRSADAIWVTTPSRLASLARLRRLVRGRARLGIVPIGSNAAPVPAAAESGLFRVGLFSSLATGKRFDLVLGAFAEVARESPNAELRLIGDLGDDRSRRFRALKAEIERHPASGRIVLTGKLPLPEVAREVAALSVYLFPMDRGASTRSGTLPLPLGSGVPVVAFRGEETSDLFLGDKNVVFARDLSNSGFAASIRRLIRDPALGAQVAQGGLDLYRSHLTWPRIADLLLHVESGSM